MDSENSVRRWRNSRTVPGTSASDMAAAITTAASVGCGRLRSRPGTTNSIRVMASGPDQAGDLCLGAGLLGHGRSRPAGGNREPLEESGGDVGGADSDHLPATVDLLPASRRERRRGRDGVGERDDGDADRARRRSRPRSESGDVRNREGREAPRQACPPARRRGADRSKATGGERSKRRPRRGRPGIFGSHRWTHHDHGQAEQADGDRAPAPSRRSPRPSRIPSVRRRNRRLSPRSRTASGSWPTTIVRARPFM